MDPCLAGGRVLVGIDFSGASEQALLSAVGLAEREQRELELVHVFEWDGPGLGKGSPAADAPNDSAQGALSSIVRAARGRLARLCSSLVGDRVPAAIRVLVGDPALELCRAAEQSQASLLVLGAACQGGIGAGAAGRTASRTCTRSSIPVLLVAQDWSTGDGQLLLCSPRGQRLWDSPATGTPRHDLSLGPSRPGSLG